MITSSRTRRGRTVALAGRRIDGDDAGTVDGFTLDGVDVVAERLRTVFRTLRAGTLVCSAANGADLTALHVARELGMRRRIVLPFSIARFRAVSVSDRPGGALWGWLFDDLVAEARKRGDLILLRPQAGRDADAFESANARVVEEAARAARADRMSQPVGIVVWDGASRGPGDATAAFCERIRHAGYPLREVPVGA
jgi:hypothetical protein